jgi:hypothetical protein
MDKYFVVHQPLMVHSLLSNAKKPDIYDLSAADGIRDASSSRIH